MKSQNIYISGEPGYGKRRLLKEILLPMVDEERVIIHFDYHGEVTQLIEQVSGSHAVFEERGFQNKAVSLPFSSNESNTEYLIAYLQLVFQRAFEEEEEEFLNENIGQFLKENEKRDITIEEMIKFCKSKGKIGATIAYQDYLLKEKKEFALQLDPNVSLHHINFHKKQDLYRPTLAYLLTHLIQVCQNFKKDCLIVIEDYHYSRDSLTYRLIEGIVNKKIYPHIHILLVNNSLYVSDEQTGTLRAFDTVYLMRQPIYMIPRIHEIFQLSEESMKKIRLLDVGGVLKIQGKEQTFYEMGRRIY